MTNAAEPKVIPGMTAHFSKFTLTAHIISSVGWFGAVAAFLVLGIAGRMSQDAEVVRSSYLAMNLIGLFVIVPLSLAALLTGLIQSLGTHWDLFRAVLGRYEISADHLWYRRLAPSPILGGDSSGKARIRDCRRTLARHRTRTGRNPTSDSRQRRYSSAARGHRAVSVQTVGTHSLRTA